MKTFFSKINSIFHKREGHEAWSDVNYCLVLENKKYDFHHSLGEEPFYYCVEFHTKEKALKYIENHVAKSDKKYCHLYKKIKV